MKPSPEAKSAAMRQLPMVLENEVEAALTAAYAIDMPKYATYVVSRYQAAMHSALESARQVPR